MNELKEFKDVLKNNGYHLKRTRGSHQVFSNGERVIVVNKNLNRIVAKRLIKENCLAANEFLRRYEKYVI